jgi:hypothetical protein
MDPILLGLPRHCQSYAFQRLLSGRSAKFVLDAKYRGVSNIIKMGHVWVPAKLVWGSKMSRCFHYKKWDISDNGYEILNFLRCSRAINRPLPRIEKGEGDVKFNDGRVWTETAKDE